MSEKFKSIVESIMASKPIDTTLLFNEEMADRISGVMPSVLLALGESVVGPEDEEEHDEIAEIDFDEMSDEDFTDLLNQMSDEDFDDLISEIDDLDESELMEISKDRLSKYINSSREDLRYQVAKSSDHFSKASKATTKGTASLQRRSGEKASDKAANRIVGLTTAKQKLAKEEVELDEISKARVGAYAVAALGNREKARNALNKAGSDAYKTSGHIDRAKRNGPDRDYGETDSNHADRIDRLKRRKAKEIAARDAADHTYDKRGKGIANASKRLAKEEVEQVDEISVKTLKSYMNKSNPQLNRNQPSDPIKLKKRTNRENGQKQAFGKINNYKVKVAATKEDVDFTDEEFEAILENMTVAEFEQLDELSKDRLNAYIGAAKKDKEYQTGRTNRHAKMAADFKNPTSKRNLEKSSAKALDKTINRARGIVHAQSKIARKKD